MRYPGERIALFIDGPNFLSSLRALGIDIDFQRLLDEFDPEETYYYAATNSTTDDSTKRLRHNHLEHLGITVVTRDAKQITGQGGVVLKFKSDMDVELAVDMVDKASQFDRVILFSGDSDFEYVVKRVKEKGVKVTIVSNADPQSPNISQAFRRCADEFLDLAGELRDKIGKKSMKVQIET